jgi:hypothetical protein
MNNMKTAMQELYDWVEQRDFYISKEWLKVLLEKEKQQIINAHGVQMKGVNNHKCITGEQYYKETFKQD